MSGWRRRSHGRRGGARRSQGLLGALLQVRDRYIRGNYLHLLFHLIANQRLLGLGKLLSLLLATEIEARFRNCERDAESMTGTCFDDLKLMLSGLLKYVQEKKYKAWRVSIRELESRKLSTQYSYF